MLKMAANSLKLTQGCPQSLKWKSLLDSASGYEDFAVEDLSNILQNCRKQTNKELAIKLYTCICSHGLEAHARLGNFLVPMLVDCGSLLYAQQVFNKVSDGNEHTWTSLMQCYLDHGDSQYTCHLFQKMQDNSVRPSKFTMQVLLKACTSLAFVEGIHGTHGYFVEDSFEADSFVGNALVHTYASFGLLAEAISVFDSLIVQDVVSWTSLIMAYAEHEFVTLALNCWEQMQVQGVSPNAFTAAAVLTACGSFETLKKGHEIHSFVVTKGFEADSFVGNTLIDLYGKCGYLHEAKAVFNSLPVKDQVTWAALIMGYTKQGHIRETHKCLKQMKEMRIATNLILWNALMADFAELGLSEEVLECIKLVKEEGLHPDAVTFTVCLNACRDIRCLTKGKLTHMEATKVGAEADNVFAKTLVDMYCKCGSFVEARHLFDILQAQEIITWTILVSGYGEYGFLEEAEACLEEMRGKGLSVSVTVWNVLIAAYFEARLFDEALNCFERMQLERIVPNAGTYVSVLKSWCAIGSMSGGQGIHLQITKEGYEKDLFVSTCLIDLYAKCGTLTGVQNIFESMPGRDKVTWSSFIAALAERCLVTSCFDALLAMQMDGLYPNADAFAYCLKACNDTGALTCGQYVYFQVLEQGVENDVSLGPILISFFMKRGLLEEAEYVFNSAETRDLSMWNSLISGHAEQGRGEKVLELLCEMQQCSVFPGISTYACSLKAGFGDVEVAACQQLHAELVKDGFESDLSISSCLIDIYSRHELFEEAQDVLAEMPMHDAVSWTALIAGYARCMLNDEALWCFKLMKQEGLCPKHDTFVWSLKACGNAGDVGRGYDMHCEILKCGLEVVSFVGNSLVEMYTRFGSFSEAQQVFDMLTTQNMVSWNTIITGCAENGFYAEALDFAKRILVGCLSMDDITVTGILKACVHSGALYIGQIIHAEVMKRGFEDVPAVGSSLVEMYLKGSLVDDAWEAFKKLFVKDIHLWTSLVSGYASQGDSKAAVCICKKMKDTGILPDGVTYLSLLTVCAHAGLVDEAQCFCNFLKKEGVVATLEHYNCLIDLLARAGQLMKAKEVIKSLPMQPNLMSWIAILGACRKWGGEGVGKLAFCHTDELTNNLAAPHILLLGLSTGSFCGSRI